MQSILGDTFINRDGEVNFVQLEKVNVVCLYFTAAWCPPCKTFNSILLEFYSDVNFPDKRLQIIQISSDKDAISFAEYFSQMPWLAIPYGDSRIRSLINHFKITGIPILILLNQDGSLAYGRGRADVQGEGPPCFERWLTQVNQIIMATSFKSAVKITEEQTKLKAFEWSQKKIWLSSKEKLSGWEFEFVNQKDEDLNQMLVQWYRKVLVGVNYLFLGVGGYSAGKFAVGVFRQLMGDIKRKGIEVVLGCLEIRNNQIFDLLNEEAHDQYLSVREFNGMMVIQNLNQFSVESSDQFQFFMRRKQYNEQKINQKYPKTPGQKILQVVFKNKKHQKSKLVFCDMNRQDNKSYDSFYEVISSLSQATIPNYENSIFTNFLKDILSLNSKIILLLQLSNSPQSLKQSLHILSILQKFQKIFKKTPNSPILKEFSTLNKFLQPKKRSVTPQALKSSINHLDKLVHQNRKLQSQLKRLTGQRNPLVNIQDFISNNLNQGVAKIKEKLLKEGRCPICTLETPCVHQSNPPEDLPKKQSLSRRGSTPLRRKSPVNIKAKIFLYREKKLQKHLEQLKQVQQQKQRKQKNLQKMQARRKKYFQDQKIKIQKFRALTPKLDPKPQTKLRSSKPKKQQNSLKSINHLVDISCRNLQKTSLKKTEDSLDLISRITHKQMEVPLGVTCFTWNADYTQIAVATNSTQIQIYQIAPNSLLKLHTLKHHHQLVSAIDWHPTTNRIISCSHDRNVVVWELNQTWRASLVSFYQDRGVLDCSWSVRGDKFAVGTGSKLIGIGHFSTVINGWNTKRARKMLASSVTTVRFDPTGRVVAAGSTDSTVVVMTGYIPEIDDSFQDTGRFSGVKSFGDILYRIEAGSWVNSVVWSPGGQWLAVAVHDSQVIISDLSCDKRLQLDGRPIMTIESVGEKFVGAGFDFTPYVFEYKGDWTGPRKIETGVVEEQKQLSRVQMLKQQYEKKRERENLGTKHKNCVTCVRNIDGNRFATADILGAFHFWSLN